MSRVKIKFCGITNIIDAENAVKSGADMLGFNFYPTSPRYVEPTKCLEVIEMLQQGKRSEIGTVVMVGVFVNVEPDEVIRIMDHCGLDLAQLSGNEIPEFVERTGSRAFKVIRPLNEQSLVDISGYFPKRNTPPSYLIDAHVKGEYGGTGKPTDWEQAAELARIAPILLAGGLTPKNVLESIRAVNPWGVDVASGIESEPGKKDHKKMLEFAEQVRKAD